MEYLKYCPQNVPTEYKKMQRFELGLSYEIHNHIESDIYDTLEKIYKRIALVGNVLSLEKEREKTVPREKRKEVMSQPAVPRLNII